MLTAQIKSIYKGDSKMTNEQAIMICETVKGYYQLPYRLQQRIELERLTKALHYRNVTDYTAEYIEEAHELVKEFLEYEV